MWRLTIFWYPSNIRVQALNTEIIVVHFSTLLFTEIGCVWRAIVDVAWSILNSRSNAIFSAVGRSRRITFTCWWLNTTATSSTALIESTDRKISREKREKFQVTTIEITLFNFSVNICTEFESESNLLKDKIFLWDLGFKFIKILTSSKNPNRHRFWSKLAYSVVRIYHVDTNGQIRIQCHQPREDAVSYNLHYHCHTIAIRTVAKSKK